MALQLICLLAEEVTLGVWVHLNFSTLFLQRGATFITSSWLPWMTEPVQMSSTLNGKNLLP